MHHMSQTKLTENHLKKYIGNQERFLNATNITFIKMTQWCYFARCSANDMESGKLWRILEMQGKYGMLYAGSSVIFESAKSVTEYNEILVENIVSIATKTNLSSILHGNIFILFFEFLLYCIVILFFCMLIY